MKLYLFIIGVIILLFTCEQQLRAQTAEQASPPADSSRGAEDKNKPEQAQEQNTQEQSTNDAKPPKKVFKPSEEISEDRPVPFPVDI